MMRNMVTSLLNHERITTTDAKAKELRSITEKMVTLGKRGDLHAMRQAASYIRDKKVVTKLFSTIAPRYQERNGGYTRIVKLGARPGDNALVSVIELVEENFQPKPAKKKPAQNVESVAPAVAIAAASLISEVAAPEEIDAAETGAAPVTGVTEEGECEAKAD
jgi:large subunit ribosomal protein L17